MKRKTKTSLIVAIAILTIAISSVVAIACTSTSWRTRGGVVIQKAGEAFLHNALTDGKITHSNVQMDAGTWGDSSGPKEGTLANLLTNKKSNGNLDTSDDPLVVDVRAPDTDGDPDRLKYETAHIKGSIYIDRFERMADKRNLDKLDTALAKHVRTTGNDVVVVYCNSGHTAGILTGVLGTLGYNVRNLKKGFNDIHSTTNQVWLQHELIVVNSPNP
jgi:rhodanese-related sulfurtransferase